MNKREIKFRCWYNGKMIYRNPIMSFHEFMVTPEGCVFIHGLPGKVNGSDGSAILLQWTGLHDRNGKEIYEGDYFLVDDVKLIVTFEDGKFCFDNTGGSYGRDHINQDRVGRLVIAGHIYE